MRPKWATKVQRIPSLCSEERAPPDLEWVHVVHVSTWSYVNREGTIHLIHSRSWDYARKKSSYRADIGIFLWSNSLVPLKLLKTKYIFGTMLTVPKRLNPFNRKLALGRVYWKLGNISYTHNHLFIGIFNQSENPDVDFQTCLIYI